MTKGYIEVTKSTKCFGHGDYRPVLELPQSSTGKTIKVYTSKDEAEKESKKYSTIIEVEIRMGNG